MTRWPSSRSWTGSRSRAAGGDGPGPGPVGSWPTRHTPAARSALTCAGAASRPPSPSPPTAKQAGSGAAERAAARPPSTPPPTSSATRSSARSASSANTAPSPPATTNATSSTAAPSTSHPSGSGYTTRPGDPAAAAVRSLLVAPEPVLIVPGRSRSGPDRWQARWARDNPGAETVQQRDRDHPERQERVPAPDAAVRTAPGPVILVAHSLGCHTVAHRAAPPPDPARRPAPVVKAALLVAPPDIAYPRHPRRGTDRRLRPASCPAAAVPGTAGRQPHRSLVKPGLHPPARRRLGCSLRRPR